MTIFLNVISTILQSVIFVERKQNIQGTYSLNVEQHKKYGPKLKLGLETPLALIILSLPKTGCKDTILKLIVLLTKQFIFQTSRKNHNLFINDVKRKIHYYFTVESVQLKIRGELTKFNLKWDKWTNLFFEF